MKFGEKKLKIPRNAKYQHGRGHGVKIKWVSQPL